jgi:hypothetical protein
MLYRPGKDIEKRISEHIYFPIGKNYEQIHFIDQLYDIFPSQVKNSTNLDFPYTLQEARMTNKFLIADFYNDEEEVITINLE